LLDGLTAIARIVTAMAAQLEHHHGTLVASLDPYRPHGEVTGNQADP
jgi:hypothetical protein